MKVLIMSDSHGLTHEINIIKERHQQDVAAMIHCGDSELEKNNPYMSGMITVRGNCDRDAAYPNHVVEEIAGKRFLITHGHLYNIHMSLLNLSLKGEETEANIICFGHSHAAGSELIDGKLYINPGSIREPRGFTEKTYAILEMDKHEVMVTFRDIQGKIVDSLTKTYHLG